ncbi:hypothetical protein GCM10010435_56430 [Winogradskya consettensis]|uniref:Uncharacterized protein n=1 Tax=Winogradskya consettensis TaxID=113560 RepID=A0A919VS33_9ACTN|nr:hypothetical protein Aco04nite_05890 [Actinoplanes consettensis]
MVDETGQNGDAGTAEGGTGADSRDRTLLNGWAARESPWSNAGAALDAEADIPAWRRPATEARPFHLPQSFPPAPEADLPEPASDIEPFPLENAAAPRWSSSRARYSDLLNHLSPNGDGPADPPPPPARPDPLSPELLRGDETTPGLLPSSAPPYPYEGDLDDARQPRSSYNGDRPFPSVRPAAPGPRSDWAVPESARHALEPTPAAGLPRVLPATDESRSGDQRLNRPSYDPSSFPRRLPYEAPQPAFTRPGEPGAGTPGEQAFPALPQRVPAEPDVPTVPEPPSVEPTAETPALARIATHLRRDDAPQERHEGFDVNAILEAVREVDGVRDAALRTTPAGAHSLRLDLAEGADPAEVSRQVARLLQDRMGLDAAMQGAMPMAGGPLDAPPRPGAPAPRSAPPSAGPPLTAPRSIPTVAPRSAPPARPVSSAPAPTSAPPSGPPVAGRAPMAPSSAPPAGVPLAPFVPSQPNPAARTLPQRLPTTTEHIPGGIDPAKPRPLLDAGSRPGPRIMIENVQVNTFGTEATVKVRLVVDGQIAAGEATGPSVDGYLLRLCATATANAVDQILTRSGHADGPAKCFIEHAAAVPFGSIQVAVVIVLLATDGWVEQLAGSAVVTGDDRHAMVRATLAAVNRRLEALLS